MEVERGVHEEQWFEDVSAFAAWQLGYIVKVGVLDVRFQLRDLFSVVFTRQSGTHFEKKAFSFRRILYENAGGRKEAKKEGC